MEKDFEKKYHDVEKEHWWFKSRRKYLLDLLQNAPKDSKVLDIGCSSGIFLKDLVQLGFSIENLYGVDISEKAIANCKANGIPNAFVMDAQHITLNESFDIIIASDCLEHLENDQKAIQNWKSLLKTGGKMYVFVPAFMSLWSYHDEVNMHHRRYTNAELRSKLEAENLHILKSSYWNFFLFLPVYVFRKLSAVFQKNKRGESDISIGNTWVNTMLLLLIVFENKLLKVFNFPFGVSTFCIVQRKA
ncbi:MULTISPECIES: class I SAM-dependent methyltransferase [Flavobacterium]|uniref:Class I SAM-dependent methyltransferase n=1 Tax=Flavobacterium sedimenticola TaxID=3043286 RepID=A0ABT6XU48_9FLAO|nr:class I SAM-dependent methyltransferase [Flavobacterium sedimenticola]MDI9258532.1 class I SAM-dependent methyltransferase [Flavobacterium sedimenticola]